MCPKVLIVCNFQFQRDTVEQPYLYFNYFSLLTSPCNNYNSISNNRNLFIKTSLTDSYHIVTLRATAMTSGIVEKKFTGSNRAGVYVCTHIFIRIVITDVPINFFAMVCTKNRLILSVCFTINRETFINNIKIKIKNCIYL